MLASTTHDTKRSEDVRARINLLSEIPERWGMAVREWSAMNERRRRNGCPDRNMEYLIYQTLVGAWPIETERMLAYVEKAAREAKTHTSWTNQAAEYEQALADFVRGILADQQFLGSLESFLAPLVQPGWINSLAQTLIKLTAPGVPDLYQGTELWAYSLVDPDNRRPVDYAVRRKLLAELASLSPEQIWTRANEGLPKLWVIRQTLKLRQRLPAPFGAEYRPLAAAGDRAEHVIAFCRGDRLITVVPRWTVRLGSDWGNTSLELPPGDWSNELNGDCLTGRVNLADMFRRFPVALLVAERG
jgi:(1->4)-alpha-D-glucan 1-alpha-D-glucosylmutase